MTLLLAAGAATLAATALPAQGQGKAPRIAPGLQKKLQQNPNQLVEIVIRFDNVVPPKNANRGQTLKVLKTQLGPKLNTINAILAPFGIRLAANLNSNLWLDNSVVVKVPARAIKSLSAVADIDYVFENFQVKIPKVQSQSASSGDAAGKWHLEKVGAPTAWQAGYRGQNIRVGTLDTGIDAGHPELAGKLAGFAEFNDTGGRVNSNPHDTGNHGTHTAALIAGKSVGIAPDARVLSALVLPNGEGTFAQVIAGMQWLLDPDNNASTDDGADVVSLSLGLPGMYEEFIRPTQNLIAAGAIPVYAAGNFGPDPGSIASPGSIPEVITVGATTQDDKVPSFSSRGPVRWGSPYNGTFNKPDLMAPGQNITSAFPNGAYGSLTGTSQATPIVAGAIASLLSARNGADLAAVKNALYGSARSLGGDQNLSGHGMLNLPGALERITGRSLAQAQPAPQQPAPQQPAPQQPAPQQPAPQQPVPQWPAQQPPAAQQPAPQPPTAQQPAPQPPTAQQPAPQPPAAQQPAPQPPQQGNAQGNNGRGNAQGNPGNAQANQGNAGQGNQGNGQGNQGNAGRANRSFEASAILNGGSELRDAPFGPSNGVSAFLPREGSTARYVMPQNLAPGQYHVHLRARGDNYNGWPVVSLRLNGREAGKAELNTVRYEVKWVATMNLKGGDTLDVVFLNDAAGNGQGQDRNAIIDHLVVDPVK